MYMQRLKSLIEPRPPLPVPRQYFSNRTLKAMILPLLVEQVLQMAVGLADTMMVSYAGEAVVAGVGLDTMIHSVFLYLFSAIAAGGSVVVSQYLGSRDRKNACLAASQIVCIAALTALLCMGAMLLFAPSLLRLMYPATEEAAMDAAQIYMRIASLSFPANAVYNAGAAVYRTMGRTRVTLRVSLLANLLNAAGNAVGIFVLHAGAAGVAWPTVISWTVAAAVMTLLCFRKKNEVTLSVRGIVRLHLSMDRRILGVAVPNSVENTLFQLSKVLLGMLTATFGTSQIAANSIGQTFWYLAACTGLAMSTVFIAVIGRCVGADDAEAAEWYMRKLIRIALLIAVCWNALNTALTPLVLPLYSLEAETKRLILATVFIHNTFSATVQTFSTPLSAGMRAAGDVKYTMYASLFANVVCLVFFSFLLAKWLGMGVIGIALAMCLDWCVKAVLLIRRFRSGKWKNRKVI